MISAGWGEAHVPKVLLLADDVAGTARKMAGFSRALSGELPRVPPRGHMRHRAQRAVLRVASTHQPLPCAARVVFRPYGDFDLRCRRDALLRVGPARHGFPFSRGDDA